MNLVLLFPEDFVASGPEAGRGCVRLAGRRFDYVQRIHRAAIGDRLCVGLLDDRIGEGTVTRLDDDGLEMRVVLDAEPPTPIPITLVLAMPRPLVLKRILIGATSLGIKKIVLMHANRVERSFWNSSALRAGELEKPLYLGLEQARDTRMPEVLMRTRFKPFVEDELPGLADGTRAIVAHPGEGRPCPRGLNEPLTLIVGPEGGFIPYEIEKLRECGCGFVDLGERILRVETVIPYLVGRLS